MSLATTLTYALPHRLLSSLARRLAYSSSPRLKQWLIDTVTRRFGVDLSEAAESDAAAYPTFNAFFTRALKPGARVADPDPRALLMPADGHVSQCGSIGRDGDPGRIFQAKGQSFSAAELLGDAQSAQAFEGGLFATVYLSPRDYHRVHMPWTGTLRETVHIPGRLFSVGTAAVAHVPRLFARNERLVCHFDTDFGPMASVMVGALLVSGVETVWSGMEIPAYGDRITRKDYRGKGIVLERFAEMARFNYGSTVIVLLPPGVAELAGQLRAESPVRLGQALAHLVSKPHLAERPGHVATR
ncbi:archaetidylserine decarboxylase [Pseudoxanthomonas wuyuanensis]